jgi:ribosomal protein L19E
MNIDDKVKFYPALEYSFTEERFREYCHKHDMDQIHIFRHYLKAMKNEGIMSERIYKKLMNNLRKKALEKGIVFS